MRTTSLAAIVQPFALSVSLAAGADPDAPTDQASTTGLFGLTAAPIDSPLVTDRPDFTESAATVPVGRAQLEFGYTFTYNDDGGTTRTHNAPEALIRLGLADDFELRIGLPDYEWTSGPAGDDDDGFTDSSIGAKIRFLDQDGARPETALILQASLPTGEDGFTSDGVDPGAILALAWDLGDGWGFAVNGGASLVSEDGGGREEFTASAALAVPLTERLGAYVEYFGVYSSGSREQPGPQHYVDGGFTYLFNNNLQFDVRIGAGLNERSDDLFAGAGFAIRF